MTSLGSNAAALLLPGKVWTGEAPTAPVRLLSSGLAAWDELLGGGVARGGLNEIVGAVSSGRTALMYALLASATRQHEVAALVDLPDALDPASLAAARAELGRILWVRPPSWRDALKSTELLLDAGGFGLVVLDLDAPAASRLPMQVWPRLRSVARRSGSALVVLAPRNTVGSFATLRVVLAQRRVRWRRTVLDGAEIEATLTRKQPAIAGRRANLALST